MILFRTFEHDKNLMQVITQIITEFNLNILAKLRLYPEENCQVDGLPVFRPFDPASIQGTWWYGALIWPGGPVNCQSVQISNDSTHHQIFKWSDGAEGYLFPNPRDPAVMIEDAANLVGDFIGVVSHFDEEQQFWIWTYTTLEFGMVFTKANKMSDAQIKGAVDALTNMGYFI
eukprot:CAMPEP_0114590260 /NCGR_PEP_ID=MMETSP0125-20121206/12543_1 /TAXON_ID=485358 ORGANISM="Aristerostoma sp., Strain ATCC 50986" /NCGR_SAMPLE_ID=MMETSP0125 /ASSEMBLY_ACC=CAM_ASM_000245 /LENGTH=172 /DNA_ID=CAMNT_0001787639 /DNA_START=313 /DNA_END=828 /DNA_ORIENTATION=+